MLRQPCNNSKCKHRNTCLHAVEHEYNPNCIIKTKHCLKCNIKKEEAENDNK